MSESVTADDLKAFVKVSLKDAKTSPKDLSKIPILLGLVQNG